MLKIYGSCNAKVVNKFYTTYRNACIGQAYCLCHRPQLLIAVVLFEESIRNDSCKELKDKYKKIYLLDNVYRSSQRIAYFVDDISIFYSSLKCVHKNSPFTRSFILQYAFTFCTTLY